jgi:hypothetical protein
VADAGRSRFLEAVPDTDVFSKQAAMRSRSVNNEH